ncbi:PAS domain-containing protein [Minwuia sp.]|uniref:PAS domain-containing protein n=1 Tax=Minwuia sp. TaxID=2493630 RepID=UPI003A94AF20
MSVSLRRTPEERGFGAPPAHFDERIGQFYAYWDHKREGSDVPDRADFDPLVEIPRLLSNVWLLDIERPTMRFRYRLLGNDMVSAGVVPKAGEYLDERPSAGNIQETIDAFRQVCETRTPYWRAGKPHLVHDRFVSGLQLLALPISLGRSGNADMLMNMTVYRWLSPDDDQR